MRTGTVSHRAGGRLSVTLQARSEAAVRALPPSTGERYTKGPAHGSVLSAIITVVNAISNVALVCTSGQSGDSGADCSCYRGEPSDETVNIPIRRHARCTTRSTAGINLLEVVHKYGCWIDSDHARHAADPVLDQGCRRDPGGPARSDYPANAQITNLSAYDQLIYAQTFPDGWSWLSEAAGRYFSLAATAVNMPAMAAEFHQLSAGKTPRRPIRTGG